MCGLTGYIQTGVNKSTALNQLDAMLRPIQHRGPDDKGLWFDEQHFVALGHQRLSILDLSPAGHQPMASHCGRFVIVFNGEIYNHLELRKTLEQSNANQPINWRGHSDTETLLACFTEWGIEKTLKACVGMFAIVLWDKQEKTLTLTRDRIGEKPLYYGWQKDTFLFGSELKALKAHPSFNGATNMKAASTFLRLNYIPAPHSIYEGIYKLIPGTYLTLTQSDLQKHNTPDSIVYWSLNQVAHQGQETPFKGSFNDAVEALEALLKNAVQLQAIADVPVGAFLSGGVDSSMITALMKSATTSEVKTFTIGMPDAALDESGHATIIANYLKTHHVNHMIQPNQILDLIPQLSDIWDEPLGDSSQIPTYLLCQLAKQDVTVALSGDGADEFFMGYSQYAALNPLWKTKPLGKLPWDTAFKVLSPLNKYAKSKKVLQKSKLAVNGWRQDTYRDLNQYFMDKYRSSEIPFRQQNGVELQNLNNLLTSASTAAHYDAGIYLPDDILFKVDRAAMAHSLETRAPFLDHRIIEFSYQLPLKYKLECRTGKKVLREVLYKHVPKQIVDKKKMGFSIPLNNWLKTDLREWVENHLDKIPNDSETFNKPMIDQLWKEHLANDHDHAEKLWGVVMLSEFIN